MYMYKEAMQTFGRHAINDYAGSNLNLDLSY